MNISKQLSRPNHLNTVAALLFLKLSESGMETELSTARFEPYIKALVSAHIIQTISCRNPKRIDLIPTRAGYKLIHHYCPTVKKHQTFFNLGLNLFMSTIWLIVDILIGHKFFTSRYVKYLPRFNTSGHLSWLRFGLYSACNSMVIYSISLIIVLIPFILIIHFASKINYKDFVVVQNMTFTSLKGQCLQAKGLSWSPLLDNLFTSTFQSYSIQDFFTYYVPMANVW